MQLRSDLFQFVLQSPWQCIHLAAHTQPQPSEPFLTRVSKKAVFAGQRGDVGKPAERLLEEARGLLAHAGDELRNPNDRERLRWSISPGIQEWIEAEAFLHFLKFGTLVGKAELATKVGTLVIYTEDYVLGIADLTGELMRKANSRGVKEDQLREILEMMIQVQSLLQGLPSLYLRDLTQKLNVLESSIAEVQAACYRRAVRRSEFPDLDWSPDDDEAAAAADIGPAESGDAE